MCLIYLQQAYTRRKFETKYSNTRFKFFYIIFGYVGSYFPQVYYISNEYNRNAGLTVDRRGLLASIYIIIPLLDAALPLKSIGNEKRTNEGILEGIDISKPHLSTVMPAFLLYSFEM